MEWVRDEDDFNMVCLNFGNIAISIRLFEDSFKPYWKIFYRVGFSAFEHTSCFDSLEHAKECAIPYFNNLLAAFESPIEPLKDE